MNMPSHFYRIYCNKCRLLWRKWLVLLHCGSMLNMVHLISSLDVRDINVSGRTRVPSVLITLQNYRQPVVISNLFMFRYWAFVRVDYLRLAALIVDTMWITTSGKGYNSLVAIWNSKPALLDSSQKSCRSQPSGFWFTITNWSDLKWATCPVPPLTTSSHM